MKGLLTLPQKPLKIANFVSGKADEPKCSSVTRGENNDGGREIGLFPQGSVENGVSLCCSSLLANYFAI